MKLKLYRYLVLMFLLVSSACQPLLMNLTSPSTSNMIQLRPASTPTATRTKVPTRTAMPSATLMPTITPIAIPSAMPIRALRVDYPDYATSRGQVGRWEQNMKAAGINMVGLGAGRVEWTYFKWAGHETNWAGAVTDTGHDFLAEDTARFGQWAQINAVVDVFAPNYIRAHPGTAAIRADGVPSTNLVSTTELTTGKFGKQLLAMIKYIAANYPVNSISLTEMFYHVDGYGPDDKVSYMAYSRKKDWPRNADGSIAVNDASIGNWRTHVLDIYLDKIVAICHQYGKQFYLDVGLTLDYGYTVESLNHVTNEHGTNYNVVLQHTDKIIIWGYFALDQFQPEFLKDVAQFLTQFGYNRVILSIGLWGRASPVVTAEKLKRAMIASQAGGISDIWITPGSLMSASHWQVLDQLWGLP
jgi:hypothetical protein